MLIRTCIVTVALFAIVTTGVSQTRPNFSGEWILNREASTLSAGADGVQNAVLRIDHREPTFLCRASFISGTSPIEYELELPTDGREISGPQPGSKATASMRWDGDALVYAARIPRADGTFTLHFRYELLDAGTRLRQVEQLRGTDHDQDNVWIFDRH